MENLLTKNKIIITVAVSALLIFILAVGVFHTKKDKVIPSSTLRHEADIVYNKLNGLIHEESYLGCLYWPELSVFDDIHQTIIKSGVSIVEKNSQDIPTRLKKRVENDSSILKIKTMDRRSVPLKRAARPNAEVIQVSSVSAFKKGDIIILADCLHAEINQIISTDKKHQQITLKYPLHYSYEHYPKVGILVEHLLYVYDLHKSHKGLVFNKGKKEEGLSPAVIKMKVAPETNQQNHLDFNLTLRDKGKQTQATYHLKI